LAIFEPGLHELDYEVQPPKLQISLTSLADVQTGLRSVKI
jgi:hypothetical protein